MSGSQPPTKLSRVLGLEVVERGLQAQSHHVGRVLNLTELAVLLEAFQASPQSLLPWQMMPAT